MSELKPWGPAEIAAWSGEQTVRRSYLDDVLAPLVGLHDRRGFRVEKYGKLSHDPDRYPLHSVQIGQWSSDKPTIIVTGGVHGYETSGVHGAVEFLKTRAHDYAKRFNLLVFPCVSPWGYETINRWNIRTQDPNRGNTPELQIEEAAAVIEHVRKNYKKALKEGILAHTDLHEATDDDPEKFEPVQAAKLGQVFNPATDASIIPPGFFTIFDQDRYTGNAPDLGKAIVEAVRNSGTVPIAPVDAKGEIYGQKPVQEGVITTNIPTILALFSNPTHAITTEQYGDKNLEPDKVEACTQAQVAALEAALDHLRPAA